MQKHRTDLAQLLGRLENGDSGTGPPQCYGCRQATDAGAHDADMYITLFCIGLPNVSVGGDTGPQIASPSCFNTKVVYWI
jgi:hypothetical protein